MFLLSNFDQHLAELIFIYHLFDVVSLSAMFACLKLEFRSIVCSSFEVKLILKVGIH